MASDNLSKLLRSAKKHRDFSILARAISLIDQQGPKALACPELNSEALSFRLGITGPPGAGKSTLIAKLITQFREHKLSVAVLAVDPSSPLSQGAILGDRIRMQEHLTDKEVYVRSLGSRGAHGGLSSSIYLMARALEFFGFDFIIIETVGVGQSEVEIMNVADCVTVIVVPESGDSIQAMKAGLFEVSDVFVVNKSDRAGADSMAKELETTIGVKVFNTEANVGRGVTELANFLVRASEKSGWKKKRILPQRLKAEARSLIDRKIRDQVEAKIAKVKTAKDLQRLLR